MSSSSKLSIRDKTIFDGFIVKRVFKYFFAAWFKLAGWKQTDFTPEGAGVTVAAPHTSNWDFFYALASAILSDVKIYFSIKDSWCKIPVIGNVVMWMGAIPINRSSNGQVSLIKEFIEKHKDERIFFLFTPEGTRGKVDKWRTGFYHIALDCGLPIFLAKVDYQSKEAGVFHSYTVTGDKEREIEAIQMSYSTIAGKYIEKQYPAYKGLIPELPDNQKAIVRAAYFLKECATRAELQGKAKLEKLTADVMNKLVAEGLFVVTSVKQGEATYSLTGFGRGFMLHTHPTL